MQQEKDLHISRVGYMTASAVRELGRGNDNTCNKFYQIRDTPYQRERRLHRTRIDEPGCAPRDIPEKERGYYGKRAGHGS
jgi:hypothetical protein